MPEGAVEISTSDQSDIDVEKDCVVLKLKNQGVVNIEVIYMSDLDDSFQKIRESVTGDARSIGAKVTNVNSDSSEFLMELGSGSDDVTQHHLLFKLEEFVFEINFFKDFNPQDFQDVKEMLSSILLREKIKKSSNFVIGQRINLGSVQVIN